MRRFTKPLDLYRAQKAYFDGVRLSARRMHFEIARGGLQDWSELTSGATPTGKARTNLLRRLGHPFGRNPAVEKFLGASGYRRSLGRRRGTRGRLYTRYHLPDQTTYGYRQTGKDRLAAEGLTGELPLLPIGQISSRLHSSIRLTRNSESPQQFAVGPRNPGPSIWSVVKGGTRRVVARGIEREIEKRFRARNKAFVDTLKERQKDPN